MQKQLKLYDNSIVIGVIANKGGSGKTSLVTNLTGAVVKRSNDRVLIIDLDGQGNINDSFGLEDGRLTMTDVLNGTAHIEKAITRYNNQIDVLQAGEAMATFEFDILPQIKRYENPFDLLRPHIEMIRHKYNYIFIDTPPSLSLIVGNTLLASDYVLIPFVPEVYAIKGLKRVITAVQEFQEAGNAVQIGAVVPMLVDDRTNLHNNLLQQARRFCLEKDVPITKNIIPRSIRFPEATAYENKPATMGKKSNAEVVQNYFSLWDELRFTLKQ